jgi:hypothetical protein
VIESAHGKMRVANSKEQYKALGIHWGTIYNLVYYLYEEGSHKPSQERSQKRESY